MLSRVQGQLQAKAGTCLCPGCLSCLASGTHADACKRAQPHAHLPGACSYGGEGLEHNQNGPRQVLCDWLDKAGGCTLFDFPTKGILAEAVANTQYWRLRDSENKPPGLMGWWPSRAVTFIDNHDTGGLCWSGVGSSGPACI